MSFVSVINAYKIYRIIYNCIHYHNFIVSYTNQTSYPLFSGLHEETSIITFLNLPVCPVGGGRGGVIYDASQMSKSILTFSILYPVLALVSMNFTPYSSAS